MRHRPSLRSLPLSSTSRGSWLLRATLAVALVACGGGPPPAAAPAPAPAPRPIRAAPGDTVYVIEHFVRADRRDQFERFLVESYWPAVRHVARSDTATARVLHQTRVIHPARANDDGSFTYLFLMDPVVPGEEYNILELLRQVYPAAETERRYRELTESWARPFQARAYVQPRYPHEP